MAKNNSSFKVYRRRTYRILYGIIEMCFHWLFGLVYGGKGKSMPPITDLLLLESATSIARKIRTKKITSSQVVQSFIDRIREVNPILNCVVAERFEEAKKEAQLVDNLIKSGVIPEDKLAQEKPFLGVPFTTKDCIPIKGLIHSSGLVKRQKNIATEDAKVVASLRNAGAIPIALTNVSELCMWWESANNVHGRSNNPYNTNHIVGGSSGGEGCAQAAAVSAFGSTLMMITSPIHANTIVKLEERKRFTQRSDTLKSGIVDHVWKEHHHIQWKKAEVLHREEQWFRRKFKEAVYVQTNEAFSQASVEIRNVWKPLIDGFGGNRRSNHHQGIGSDIGGSIRMPSFFNGVFGHKPSPFVVSNHGQYPIPVSEEQNRFLGLGPICRRAEDLLPLMKVITNQNGVTLKLDDPVDVKKLKWFYQDTDTGSVMVSQVAGEIRELFSKIAKHLDKAHGIKATKVCYKRFAKSSPMWFANMKAPNGPKFQEQLANLKGSINPCLELFKWVFRQSEHTFIAIATCILENGGIKYGDEKYDRMVKERNDLRRELLDLLDDDGVFLYPTHPTSAPYHNEPLIKPFNFSYTGVINVLGLPATHCPMGLDKNGLPIGIQVVAAEGNDRLCLAVASELEKAFGGWVPPAIKA